jgi:DNA-directed RNA polymerase subunit K/omega
VLTSQRARQLQNGARPRVDPDGHKFPWVARHEVMAGMISWDVTPKVVQAPIPR